MKLAAFLTLAVLVFGGAMSFAPAPARAVQNCDVDASIDGQEQEFLRLINDYRRGRGLTELALSDTLSRAAAWKSEDMAAHDYFSHDDGPIGRSWSDRIRDCGYTYNTWLGENLAAGHESAASTFEQWRNSPGHNANMLNTNFTAIGIGRAYSDGSTYGWYWATDFGGVTDVPSPPPASYPCADLDGDGHVMVSDILFVVTRYESSDLRADLNGDGNVRASDILVVVSQYRTEC